MRRTGYTYRRLGGRVVGSYLNVLQFIHLFNKKWKGQGEETEMVGKNKIVSITRIMKSQNRLRARDAETITNKDILEMTLYNQKRRHVNKTKGRRKKSEAKEEYGLLLGILKTLDRQLQNMVTEISNKKKSFLVKI